MLGLHAIAASAASSFDGSAWYSKPLNARWTGRRSRVAQRRRAASADSKALGYGVAALAAGG